MPESPWPVTAAWPFVDNPTENMPIEPADNSVTVCSRFKSHSLSRLAEPQVSNWPPKNLASKHSSDLLGSDPVLKHLTWVRKMYWVRRSQVPDSNLSVLACRDDRICRRIIVESVDSAESMVKRVCSLLSFDVPNENTLVFR
jgi:hypothetical protein